jgi:putative redox protein
MTTTITKWVKEEQFTSHMDQNTIKIDGNKKNGFGPKALLLSAIAACSGIDVVEVLKKMRVDFSSLEIEVKADQTKDHPRVFTDIYIVYRLKTDKINEEKVRKAINLSLEKYCGVAAMLRKNSPVHYSLILT